MAVSIFLTAFIAAAISIAVHVMLYVWFYKPRMSNQGNGRKPGKEDDDVHNYESMDMDPSILSKATIIELKNNKVYEQKRQKSKK